MKKLLTLILVLILSTTLPLTVMAEKADQTPQQNLDALKQKEYESTSAFIHLSLKIEEYEVLSYFSYIGPAGVIIDDGGKSTGERPLVSIVEKLKYSEETDYKHTDNDAARPISSRGTIGIIKSGDIEIDSMECFQITNPNTDRYNTTTKAVPCIFTETENGYQIKSSDLDMWKEFDSNIGQSDYIGIIIIRVMYEGNSIDEYGARFKPATDSEVRTMHKKNQGQGGALRPGASELS